MTIRTLCVDDDSTVLNVLKDFLASKGHQVFATTSVQEAIKALGAGETFTFCISDYQMPEMNGDDFLRIVADKSPATVRLLMSGYSNTHLLHQLTLDGACSTFIEKPFQLSALVEILETHLLVVRSHVSTEQFIGSADGGNH
ncbi:MAG: response regulator [Desulfuromonadales bacterium]